MIADELGQMITKLKLTYLIIVVINYLDFVLPIEMLRPSVTKILLGFKSLEKK